MTSIAERKRILARRVRPRHRIATMEYRGRFFFAELARRPVCKGQHMDMTEIQMPVCRWEDGEHWSKYRFFAVRRSESNLDRLLAITDAANAELERRQTALADAFEFDLREAREVWSRTNDDGSWRPGEAD